MTANQSHRFDRYSLLLVVAPVFVLLVAAGLYSAAEGATVCLDFRGTCTATEASAAPILRSIALVVATASVCALFLACRRIGGGLHLDLMSDTPVAERPVSAATTAIVILVGIAVVASGIAFVPRTAGLLVVCLGPVVALAQLPLPASTRGLYAGIVVFLASSVLFGGPFLAVAFIAIACFVLATTALLSTASKGF